jgi:hypothetical protein
MSCSSKVHIPLNDSSRKFQVSSNRSILCASNTKKKKKKKKEEEEEKKGKISLEH